jgi:CheY-like chemotaxis protein
MKILIIDDEPIANFISVRLFKQLDSSYEVLDYTDPQLAMKELRNLKPDYIFVDLNMPRMSGWDFLNQMKEEGLDYKAYILTSSISNYDHEKARTYSNVIDCLEKPVKKEKLRECLSV